MGCGDDPGGTMLHFIRAAVAILIALVCFAPRPVEAKMRTSNLPDFNEKLDKQVSRFATDGRTAVESILDLAYQYELPIGIEYLDKAAMTRPIDLQFQNESIRKILIAIVQQLPEYQITFSDGLVDLFVPRERQDLSNLLNTVIKQFNINETDTSMANYELACALTHEIDPSTICAGSIAKGQLGKQKITLHLQNVKVFQIINAIVAQNGKAAWTVIASRSSLIGRDASDLWHIYPLQPPYKDVVLGQLSSLKP
jgi:hypothetical protein